MKKALMILPLFFCALFAIGAAAEKNPRVLIQTDQGDITVEIFIEKAPVTAENFLKYVDEGLYAGAAFYRVVRMDNQPRSPVRIEVIQGGIVSRETERFPPIAHETTEQTGVLHKSGAISMARNTPGSASSEFFICVGDQPELDFGGKRNSDGQGFAAFGIVLEGMEVVNKIQQLPTEGQMLRERVIIQNIQRITAEIKQARGA